MPPKARNVPPFLNRGSLVGTILNAFRRTPTDAYAPAWKALLEAFEPWRAIDAAAGERAMAYISAGDEPEILARLRAHSAFGHLIGEPGSANRPWFPCSCPEREAHQQSALTSTLARSAFYAAIRAEDAPLEALVRLGKVLDACWGTTLALTRDAGVPAWFERLMADATADFNGDRSVSPQNRPAWTARLGADLLASEERAGTDVLRFTFERAGDTSTAVPLPLLSDPYFTDDYMLEHTAALDPLVDDLSINGRTALVDLLGHERLREPLAPLLVRLALDPSKTVRAGAVKQLYAVSDAVRTPLLSDALQTG